MRRLLLFFSALCMVTQVAVAQEQAQEQEIWRITGTVKDRDGDAFIESSVSVAETKIFAITDVNGVYSLDVPANSSKKILAFYMGFELQTKEVSRDGEVIDFTLEEDDTLFHDVIIKSRCDGMPPRDLSNEGTVIILKRITPLRRRRELRAASKAQ
ncbi:MAG: carboxypeptidase-like regulatory domain-containing protein [Rikenellaceae bacterium]